MSLADISEQLIHCLRVETRNLYDLYIDVEVVQKKQRLFKSYIEIFQGSKATDTFLLDLEEALLQNQMALTHCINFYKKLLRIAQNESTYSYCPHGGVSSKYPSYTEEI